MDMITIHHVGNGSYGFISHHLNKKSYTLKISSMTIGKSIGSSYEKKAPYQDVRQGFWLLEFLVVAQ
jgi:hypothetical protein